VLVDILSFCVHFQAVIRDLPLRHSCDVVKDLMLIRAIYPCQASSVGCSSQHVTSELGRYSVRLSLVFILSAIK